MDRKDIIKYQSDSETYLERKGVYPLFDQLLKSLVVSQPNDPLDFLISSLQNPKGSQHKQIQSIIFKGKKIFVLGPPGSLSQSLCDYLSTYNNFQILSAGQVIERQSQKDETAFQSIKKFTYITDTLALQFMENELNKLQTNSKTLVIEGFPKTRIQALEWQKIGIIPEAVIILKMAKEQIIEKCLEKIKNGKYEHIRKQDMEVLATNYAEEYILNVEQVKKLYNNIFEIEEGMTRQQAEEQISKLIQYKIYKKIPANQANIFIQGMPGSGRTSLAKTIAKKYGITYVSIKDILAQQIADKTAVGKRVLQDIQNNKLVPDEIIIGLLNRRLQKTDCSVSGYIVDGFPKTMAQLNSLKELKIKVSNVIILELESSDAFERVSGSKIDPKTGIIYDKHALVQITNDEIRLRLYDLQNATEEQITEKIKCWKTIEKKLKQIYQPIIIEINAILPQESIIEKVCEILDSK